VQEETIRQFFAILREASRLYQRAACKHNTGTTAPVVVENSEDMRYWALDVIICATGKDGAEGEAEAGRKRVARIAVLSLMGRFREGLSRFLLDSKIRGQIPFGRFVNVLEISLGADFWCPVSERKSYCTFYGI
jgi:hypothetical protein